MTKQIVLLQALASTRADLEQLITPYPLSALRRRPEHGVWSVVEVLNHLVTTEPRLVARLQRVASEPNPILERIDPQEAAHDRDALPHDLLVRFDRHRQATLAFLKELSPGAWQRPAVFSQASGRPGPTTLRFLVQDIIHHDIQHLNQIAEILARLGARKPADEVPHET